MIRKQPIIVLKLLYHAVELENRVFEPIIAHDLGVPACVPAFVPLSGPNGDISVNQCEPHDPDAQFVQRIQCVFIYSPKRAVMDTIDPSGDRRRGGAWRVEVV